MSAAVGIVLAVCGLAFIAIKLGAGSPPAKPTTLAGVDLKTVAAYGEPTGADNFCSKWNRGIPRGPALQRIAMLESMKQLPPGNYDHACLAASADEFVRWANRTCASGALGEAMFASLFVSEARTKCP